MRAWFGINPPPRNYWQNDGWGWETWTVTTNRTLPIMSPQQPVDEELVRRLVREEIADLPIPFDVPDAPPEKD